MRTAGRGCNGDPPEMRFSVKAVNGAPPRSAGIGNNGSSRAMDECEGGNEVSIRASPPRRYPVINPYPKHIRTGGVRKGGGERGHGGARKGAKSNGCGGKRKSFCSKLNSKKNGPRKTRRGYLMHAFGRSGIVADLGIKEGKDRRNDVYGKAQVGEVVGDNITSSEEGQS